MRVNEPHPDQAEHTDAQDRAEGGVGGMSMSLDGSTQDGVGTGYRIKQHNVKHADHTVIDG